MSMRNTGRTSARRVSESEREALTREGKRAAGTPLGLVTTFARPEIVEPIIDDIDACTTMYADDPRDVDNADFCRLSFDRRHMFGFSTHCRYCGTAMSAMQRACG